MVTLGLSLGSMRQARIKIPAGEAPAAYHCISRIVNGERLMDETAREVLRRQMWQVAEYCGVKVLTYAILSNHFHILLFVPRQERIDDVELLRRYRILYPRPTAHRAARLEVIHTLLRLDGPEAESWRRRQLALMGDVSQYMKLLKQRFTIWFNRSHDRFGTLWAERFKSSLVEVRAHVLKTVAAYIDLNPVRAGLVADPKDYRFCGYAEAIAGGRNARAGLLHVVGGRGYIEGHARYREVLFGTGAAPRHGSRAIAPAAFARVAHERGRLPLSTVLRCRLRYLSDGAVLGSRAFVGLQLARLQTGSGQRTQLLPRPLPDCTDWGDLSTMRQLRLPALLWRGARPAA